jgi:hypothetical protein
MTIFLVVDDKGRELVSTPAVERAVWIMNRMDDAARVVTDAGVLVATAKRIDNVSVSRWFVRLGRMA